MATNFGTGSSKSLPTIGRHDGHNHQDGFFNGVALRHGWSRTFSISPQELAILDYDTLEAILEINTLKLRPMGVRVFVENPPDSGNWSKIRPWKHDGSLQSVLVQQFFERRRVEGIITRLDIRDGADRAAEGDALSLRTVGSRILNRHGDDAKSTTSTRQGGWFGLSRNTSTKSRNTRTANNTDVEDEEMHTVQQPPQPPPKPSFFSLLRPHPQVPGQKPQRRSIFDFFRSKLSNSNSNKRTSTNTAQPSDSNANDREMEEQQLRKRGWIPPGLARRQRSLKERLRTGDGATTSRNPFFGSTKSVLSRAERKKAAAAAMEDTDGQEMLGGDEDPFGDGNGVNAHGPDEFTEQDVDDFFEVERASGVAQTEERQDRAWSRFKPTKDRKKKNKARDVPAPVATPGTLGSGAAIVQKPRDAFPDSPHHKATEEID